MERIQASERTRERLKGLMGGQGEATEGRSDLVRLAARLIIEEALEGEAADALGRGYYARGAVPGSGYRNGCRTGRLKSAEGAIEYSAPQIAERFHSKVRAILGGRTAELEALFADEDGRSLLSRTAVSEITERLWKEYEAFVSRDLAEFEVVYLFIDGIAERLHLDQPREAVLAAWGTLADGKRMLLHLAPGTKEDTASCREFFQDMRRRGLPEPATGRERRSPGDAPGDRGVLPALGAPALPGAQDAQPSEQGAGGRVAGVQGPRASLLPGGFAGAGAPVARRYRGDLRDRPAFGSGLPRRRLRGLYRASQVPAGAPASDQNHEHARAAVRRSAAAHQGHPACLRRPRRARAEPR